ncbi:hypothetical protein GYMLUDRAFT_930287 [Collybiopsis luxurians FD-317 M1]|nr:hypothetical protein GYMLUDRAFT_930287 [Collybiopsis luxurians FD-317 M1]
MIGIGNEGVQNHSYKWDFTASSPNYKNTSEEPESQSQITGWKRTLCLMIDLISEVVVLNPLYKIASIISSSKGLKSSEIISLDLEQQYIYLHCCLQLIGGLLDQQLIHYKAQDEGNQLAFGYQCALLRDELYSEQQKFLKNYDDSYRSRAGRPFINEKLSKIPEDAISFYEKNFVNTPMAGNSLKQNGNCLSIHYRDKEWNIEELGVEIKIFRLFQVHCQNHLMTIAQNNLSNYTEIIQCLTQPFHNSDATQFYNQLNELGKALHRKFRYQNHLSDFLHAAHIFYHVQNKQLMGRQAMRDLDQTKELQNIAWKIADISNNYHHEGSRMIHDLRNEINCLQEVITHVHEGYSDKSFWLYVLATAWGYQYDLTKESTDIQNAINAIHKSVDLTSNSGSEKAGRLSILGTLLRQKYEIDNRVDDLHNAINASQKAVYLAWDDDPDKEFYLKNLEYIQTYVNWE